ncbi:FAD-binding oxidoreductase [Brevibacillus fluminis]|uniref:FAD-binding oxidoreductase n=2 Tax=Brevibacillus fluminis TaxID=511487 RepID=A0A3M8DRY3_9BACL|nr:FAD-binding oxidoreductase [Brevibacillus fluminis]
MCVMHDDGIVEKRSAKAGECEMAHIDSLWAATANDHRIRPALEGELTTDVAIIGGGYTGLSTAYHLAQKQVGCVVLEQQQAGWGASGRNAGMVLTGYKPSIDSLASKHGKETARELLHISVEGIKLVETIVREHRISCSLENCGNFDAAFKPAHLEALKRNQEFMQTNFGYETYVIDKERMKREEVNSDLYHGGLVDPHSYSFHPLNYALGLADAAEANGAVIYDRTEVTGIAKQGSEFLIRTSSGHVRAQHVVMATNGYTTSLAKSLAKKMVPIGSFIVATERLSREAVERLIPHNRMISDTKNFLYYFRRTPDDRILLGGRVDFNGKEGDALFGQVQQSLIEVFPTLAQTGMDYRWGGLLGFTLDFMPHIGQTEEGIHFALGYCGHGASISTLMGKLLAENVCDPLREKNSLERLPIRTVPFHSQRALLLGVASFYYHFVDKYF